MTGSKQQTRVCCIWPRSSLSVHLAALSAHADGPPPAFPVLLSRRVALSSVLSGAVSVALLHAEAATAEDGADPRQDVTPAGLAADKLYNGPTSYGFEFKYPRSWKPNKKMGNKHLYNLEVKPAKGGGLISVTIDKTSANSLVELGTLDDVAQRFKAQLQASRKREALVIVSSRLEQTPDKQMSYYTMEVRGQTRHTYAKLAVTARQLFVLALEVPEAEEAALAPMATQALASFRVEPNYLENFQGVDGQKVLGQAPELGDYFKRIPKDILQVESGDF